MGRPDVQEIFRTDIYALTGEEFSRGRSNVDVVKQMIAAGIKIIQYREKEKKKRLKYQECSRAFHPFAPAGPGGSQKRLQHR